MLYYIHLSTSIHSSIHLLNVTRVHVGGGSVAGAYPSSYSSVQPGQAQMLSLSIKRLSVLLFTSDVVTKLNQILFSINYVFRLLFDTYILLYN